MVILIEVTREKRTGMVVAAIMTMMVIKMIILHIRTVLLAIVVVVSRQTDTYICIYKHTHSSRL
jgi:hypothetical protein